MDEVGVNDLILWVRSEWKYHYEGSMHLARMSVPVYAAFIVSLVSMVSAWGEVIGWPGMIGVAVFGSMSMLMLRFSWKSGDTVDSFRYIWIGVLFDRMKNVEEIRERVLSVFPSFRKELAKHYDILGRG